MANPLFMYAPHAPGAPPFAPINECIDCVTDWVTKYLGDRTFTYTHNGNQIWGGPTKPTIRKLVSDHINGIIEAYNRYYGTPSAIDYRDMYNQLLDSYNSLDYNTMEQRWVTLKQQDPTRYNDGPIYNSTNTSGRTPKDFWRGGIMDQAAYRADHLLFQNVGTNHFFGLSKFLDANQWMSRPHSSMNNWGPDGDESSSPPPFNAIFRAYIRCFLRLFKALFPDYPNFDGGSKRKNKNKKTKKRKNKKNKSKRPRRY